MTLMGGWQAFIDGLDYHVWIDRDRKWSKANLMRLFPVTLFGWEEWKAAFAETYKRRKQDGRPVGVAYLWQRGRELSLSPNGVNQ